MNPLDAALAESENPKPKTKTPLDEALGSSGGAQVGSSPLDLALAGAGEPEAPRPNPPSPGPSSQSRRDFVQSIPKDEEFWAVLKDSTVDAIAKRNSVSSERIKELMPAWRARPEGDQNTLGTELKAGLAGAVDVIIPFGSGIKEMIASAQLSDNELRAMHDVKAVLSMRKPMAFEAAELAGGIAVPLSFLGKGASLAKQSATMGALGAASGAAEADPGERVEGALIGGGISAGLPLAFKGVAAGATAAADMAKKTVGGIGRLAKWFGYGATDELAKTIHEDDAASIVSKVDEWTKVNEDIDSLAAKTFETKEGRQAVRTNAENWVKQQPQEIREKLAKEAGYFGDDEEAKIAAAAKTATDYLRDFEQHIGKDVEREGRRSVGDIMAQEAGEDAARISDWTKEKVVEAANARRALQVLAGNNALAKKTIGTVSLLAEKAVASRHVADALDEAAGTNFAPTIDRISGQIAKAANAVAIHSKTGKEAFRLARKANMDDRELIDAIEGSKAGEEFTGLTKEKNDAVNAFKGWTESILKAAQDAGLPISALKNAAGEAVGYVPKRRLPQVEYAVAMRKKAEELGYNQQDPSSVKRIFDAAAENSKSPEREFVKEVLLGDAKRPTSVEALAKAMEDSFLPSTASTRLSQFARANMQRGGLDAPEWVRDYDVGRIYSGWLTDTFRAAYTKDEIARLRTMANAVMEAGSRQAKAADFSGTDKLKGGKHHWLFEKGKYMKTLADDLLGGTEGSLGKGVMSSLSDAAVKAERRSQELEEGMSEALANNQLFTYRRLQAEKAAVDLVKDPAKLVSDLSSNLYTNFLGGRPDAAFRNSYQVLVKTVPALGMAYGPKILAQALVEVAKSGKARKSLRDEAMQRGLVSADQARGALVNIQDGLNKAGVPTKLHRVMSTVLLSAYQAADYMNRALTVEMGRLVADDMVRATEKIKAGEKLSGAEKRVIALFRSLPAGTRADASAAIKRGDVDGARDTVERWLGGFTQLNYDKAAMSRLGRYGGPVVSMFTTWPASMAGEVAKSWRSTGNAALDSYRRGRVVASLLSPLGVLTAFDHLADASGARSPHEPGKASPERAVIRVMAGQRPGETQQGAPIAALGGWVKGRMVPPLIGTASDPISKVVAGDFESVPGAVGDSLLNLSPYGGRAIRNLYRDWAPELGWESRPYPKKDKGRGGLSPVK